MKAGLESAHSLDGYRDWHILGECDQDIFAVEDNQHGVGETQRD